MADAEAVERPLTDDEVFGVEMPKSKSVDLSPLEKAFDAVADGVRRESAAEVKAIVEKTVEKIGDIAKGIGEERKVVVDAVERLAMGSQGTAQALADVRKAISEAAPPDMTAIADSVNRIAQAVERSNAKMMEAVTASNMRIADAMERLANVEREVKVDIPAQVERPMEWDFDIERNGNGDITRVVARAVGTKPPQNALEAAQRAAKG